MRHPTSVVGWLLTAGLLVPVTVGATMVRPLSLATAAAAAGRITHGRVRAVESGRDEAGFPSTWITLDVIDTLKGDSAQTLTFKQPGVSRALPDGAIGRIPGLPTYAIGAEVVLFLHPESAAGFSSPVGLGQGVYWVERDAQGAKVRRGLGGGKPEALTPFLDKVRKLRGWSR
jgi:hypothetical protein